jgi:hypothetical protein
VHLQKVGCVSIAPRQQVSTQELALATVPILATIAGGMAAVAVHNDGDAFRGRLAREVELGSSVTKHLVGKHSEGSIARVFCSGFNDRKTKDSGVTHLPITVTIPVLFCLRSHIPISADDMNDIDPLDSIFAMGGRSLCACRVDGRALCSP